MHILQAKTNWQKLGSYFFLFANFILIAKHAYAIIKIIHKRTEEMDQQLGACTTFPEARSLTASTHARQLTTTCNSMSSGIIRLFWPLYAHAYACTYPHTNMDSACICMYSHTHTWAVHAHAHTDAHRHIIWI